MRRILGARPRYGSSSAARAAWLLPVLVLHTGLLWWLLRPAQRPSSSATSTSVWLQLVPWSPSPSQQARELDRPKRPAPKRASAEPKPSAAIAPNSVAITAVAPLPTSPRDETAAAAPGQLPSGSSTSGAITAQTPSPSPGLNLQLPRAASRPIPPAALATRDARSNSQRQSLGERMAATIGTDERLVEEDRGPGRLRVRQGTGCVDVRDSRVGLVDPFSQSMRPPPKLAESCK